MELELKHIQSYPMGKENPLMILIPKHRLKYGEQTTLPLNGVCMESSNKLKLEMLLPDDDLLFSDQVKWAKPILRPLSDLTIHDAIEHSYPDEGHLERSLLSGHAPYYDWIHFVSEHFDVFGLIEKGLAIDKNTLNK